MSFCVTNNIQRTRDRDFFFTIEDKLWLILRGPEVPRYDGVSVSYPRESEKGFLLIGIKL